MSVTVGFDVYGTLIDNHGVVVMLHDMVGEETSAGMKAAYSSQP